MKMRSPIRWFGGKGNFTQHLLPLIPFEASLLW